MSLLEKIQSDFIREIGPYSIKMPIFVASLICYSPSSFIYFPIIFISFLNYSGKHSRNTSG